jgi:hypothetical protein
MRRVTLFTGSTTTGSPNVTVTAGAVDFWFGGTSTGSIPNALANVGANCMFVTRTSGYVPQSTTEPFPQGTRVLSVDAAANVITMSQNATANVTFTDLDGSGSATATLLISDGQHDPNQPFGEIFINQYDWNGNGSGSKDVITFSVFTTSTDDLSYGESGPQTADLVQSVTGGTITQGDYSTQQRSKLVANKGFTASKYGFTAGDGATLSNRFENDNNPTKGILAFHDGGTDFTTDFGTTLTQTQIGVKQYTDNTTQAAALSYGPRFIFSSAYGKKSNDPYTTYPRDGQSLGHIAWAGTTGKTLTPSSLRPPVYINAIAAQDHDLGSNTNIYFGATSDHDDNSTSNTAHVYLASQDGTTILAAGVKGTEKKDIYFAPAIQPTVGYQPQNAYDLTVIAGQKSWAKMNYANISATSGAQLTVTHGQSRGAGTVGDQILSIQRNDNAFSTNSATIQALNTPSNYFPAAAGTFGASGDIILAGFSGGNASAPYVDGTAVAISGFDTSPVSTELNGQTKYLKLFNIYSGREAYEIYNDTGLTSPYTSAGQSANGQFGPGTFTYTATVSSGVNAKEYNFVLAEQSNTLVIKEDTNSRIEIQTANTKFNHDIVTTGSLTATGNIVGGNVTTAGTVNGGTLLTSGTLNVSGATVTGLSTSSVSEGTNLYYTTGRANLAIDAYNGGLTNLAGNVATTAQIQGATTVLKAFNETVVALGSVSGDQSSALNASSGSIYTLTATGGITINSIANAVAGTSMTIIITQDGTGSHALTSSWKFADGEKTLSTAGGAIDVISVFYDGTTYYASLTKAYA